MSGCPSSAPAAGQTENRGRRFAVDCSKYQPLLCRPGPGPCQVEAIGLLPSSCCRSQQAWYSIFARLLAYSAGACPGVSTIPDALYLYEIFAH